MLKTILGVVALLVVGLLGYAATRPSAYHVERSTVIAATPQAVWALVDDFHHFGEWSPWEHLDPGMKKQFTGPAHGVGSAYAWQGNKEAGEGKMTLLQSDPGQLVRIQLEFIKPFASTSSTDFAFTPEGAGTRVRWSMDGNNNYLAKVFTMFMNLDKRVGADFDRGLARLKSVAESGKAEAARQP